MNEKEIDYNLLEVEKGNKRNGIYLKNHIQDQHKEKVRLQERIDKAIEYIESECNEFYVNEPHYRGYQIINIEPLLDILKGSDKE